MSNQLLAPPAMRPEEFNRVPGLLRAWEVPEVLIGCDAFIEDAGTAADGTPLFAVYRRDVRSEAEVPS